MYLPSHFEERRPEALHDLIARHPLGMLVTHGSGGLDANHVPFELDAGVGPHGVLRAHVARDNPLWRSVADGDEVLVVFRAAQAYVSPNWYPSKHEAHKLVPTWNYRVVHAHGTITVRDDERYVRGLVARLTRQHEAGQPRPWKMGDAPSDYIDAMLKSIVGLEIAVARLVGKFKLSQNRETRDRVSAAQVLIDQGDTELGEAMRAVGPPA
ncbi:MULTISPECIES: FMN-binding negative transcriptional regulator [unclassified Methylibium]|uniref:FMN-binding negative transcriptional regulator n=1 Tax=unclassified Methylibium TaxID=2633235 RepID=UPI0003F3FB4E|nr:MULTISPECIES: FMN-binding negative transcriptional regulator [unclassified Methylibium]EWS52637.1 Protease synthase and sporulation protein PAI 2 [Methylibium sp. T29]EWS58034.1 Protease synthase and sporulation protein PAI 2 [Methylibium sp. T29-B]